MNQKIISPVPFHFFLKEWFSFFGTNLPVAVLGMTTFLTGLLGVLLSISQGATYEDVTRAVFYVFYVIVLVVGFLLSAHSFVNEAKNGTMELLRTLPIQLHEIVIGKFLLGAVLFLFIIPLMTVFYVWIISEAPLYVVLSGTLGLYLVGLYSFSAGIFASTLTDHYPVALLIGAGILTGIDVGAYLGGMLPAPLSDLVSHFHSLNQFSPFSRGVLDLRSAVYFISMTLMFLFFSVRILEMRYWRSHE